MAMQLQRLLALCAAFGASQVAASSVTPVEKVIQLLTGLSAQITEEGKAEAAQYDKYACFCKEQADNKLYAIETSTAKINQLTALITDLDGVITELGSAILRLNKEIKDLGDEIAAKTDVRQRQHAKYVAKAKDMEEAIAACEDAIEALKESKADLTDAKLDGQPLSLLTSRLQQKLSKVPALAAPGVVAMLEQLSGQTPARYEYHSNDIISVLENLLVQFKGMKKDLDNEEFEVNSIFEKDRLGLSNQKKFAEKEKAEKEAVLEQKTEERAQAQAEKDQETKEQTADQSFMEVLKGDCEQKAELWDQRSQMRSEELTAIDKALTELKSGVSPNWKANKKLVGIQKKAVISKVEAPAPAPSFLQAPAPSPSFLQVRSAGSTAGAEKEDLIRRVQQLLNSKAGIIHSPVLVTLAARMQVAADHFVKVRQIIKDLVEKLEADAAAEHSQKQMCDTAMAAAISDRDTTKAEIEKTEGEKAANIASKNVLLGEIDALLKQIAADKKALLEATQLRLEEQAENNKTMAMSAEGIAAVNMALQILDEFYKSAATAMVQVQSTTYTPYVAPNSDRRGNTVGDLAPEVFDDKYRGKQQHAEGIIGILEVILSDFERTNTKTQQDEDFAQGEFETFETQTNAAIKRAEGQVKTKTGEVEDLEEQILGQEEYIGDQEVLHQAAIDKLAELEPMCVEGEETWEERKAKREQEIEALKEALAILESWRS